jgi:alkylated DNA nucleotide flippase Atl1
MARKTAVAKRDDPKAVAKVEPIPPSAQGRWGEGTLVIPTPAEIDALMRRVPRGRVITVKELRELVAKKHGATIACPLTTGIFTRIAAEAAMEEAAADVAPTTPYWRTLKTEGELNPKYPGGLEQQRELLEAEGHTIVARGKRWFVADYAKSLARLRV